MRFRTRSSITALATAALCAFAAPALASGGEDRGGERSDRDRGEVITRAACSGASNAKLKAKHDDGRLEVEVEVDQNRSGVRWRVGLRRDGRRVARATRRTDGRSGSFELERRIRDTPGKNRISAVARRAGETCRMSLRI